LPQHKKNAQRIPLHRRKHFLITNLLFSSVATIKKWFNLTIAIVTSKHAANGQQHAPTLSEQDFSILLK
jgi:hypothetical protein